MSKLIFGGTWVHGGIPDVVSFIVFSNSKSMLSSRGFTRMPKEGISLSLASCKCTYCGLYTQSYVGFSVYAANLMQYIILTYYIALKVFVSKDLEVHVVRLLPLLVIQPVMF